MAMAMVECPGCRFLIAQGDSTCRFCGHDRTAAHAAPAPALAATGVAGWAAPGTQPPAPAGWAAPGTQPPAPAGWAAPGTQPPVPAGWAPPAPLGPPAWGSGQWGPVALHEPRLVEKDRRNVAMGLTGVGLVVVLLIGLAVAGITAPGGSTTQAWARVSTGSGAFSFEMPGSPVRSGGVQSGFPQETMVADLGDVGAFATELTLPVGDASLVPPESMAQGIAQAFGSPGALITASDSTMGPSTGFSFDGEFQGRDISATGHAVTVGDRVLVLMVMRTDDGDAEGWESRMWHSVRVG